MRDGMTDDGEGLGAFRRGTWWSLTGTTTVLLVVLIGAGALDPQTPRWATVIVAVALPATVVACPVLFHRRLTSPAPSPEAPGAARPAPPLPWSLLGGSGAAVLGGVLLAVGDAVLWSLAPAVMVSIAAMFLPRGGRRALIAAAVAGAAVIGLAAGPSPGGDWIRAALLPAGVVALTAWTTLGMLWAWDVAERLNTGRRLAAELAVARERLRFAADLHDIQGHHLQVIALKGELAARLAGPDPARAAEEMREVQRLAADALRDTRAVVQGYRRTTLEAEIANATRVLAAAGIEVAADVDPAAADRLPASGRNLLGLVVREATTNLLRHSGARSAEVGHRITGGSARLRVANDGAAAPSGTEAGTGLRALAERLEAAGGGLTWHHRDGRFVVEAWFPLSGTDAAAEGEAG
ncbi:sensor histidine kinase [Nocardiopsis sediminis]|uniref:Sensor histidine kinase n=1 Tax=Nocardiopsis sediminis TaxID=1778267 RepID=A0ABV8FXI4_9ACTN